MQFIIVSYKSVGEIKLNTTKQEVYSVLGKPNESFLRNTFSKSFTDNYIDLGIFINYDIDERVEAIEICPSNSTVIFQEMNLFDMTYKDILKEFRKKDTNLEEDETGFSSLLLGIGIYCPNKVENIDSLIEGIIVFREKYYD